jgi:short-subunit dehydrogenase
MDPDLRQDDGKTKRWETRMAEKRRTILITGASSGLGAGIARGFAAKGHDLALCARRMDALEALRAELAQHGGRIEIRALDVNDHDAVFATFRELDGALGGLDRIIVNAGIGGGSALGTGDFALNRAVAETDFVAALAQAEAALELFRPRNAGHLVLISSMSAVRGFPGAAAIYGAAKAGLSQLGEGLAVEFMDSPIRVTTIEPGFIRTAINAHRQQMPFAVNLDVGVPMLVRAIEAEKRRARVPGWPWALLGAIGPFFPLGALKRMGR